MPWDTSLHWSDQNQQSPSWGNPLDICPSCKNQNILEGQGALENPHSNTTSTGSAIKRSRRAPTSVASDTYVFTHHNYTQYKFNDIPVKTLYAFIWHVLKIDGDILQTMCPVLIHPLRQACGPRFTLHNGHSHHIARSGVVCRYLGMWRTREQGGITRAGCKPKAKKTLA